VAAPVTPVTARAHAFVADLAAPVLSPADHHHLARVLRLPVGAPVTVSDGRGGWRPGRLGADETVAEAGALQRTERPEPALTVGFALVKGDRPELVVQKLTELGIDRIVPFVAERTVVRWDAAKTERQLARLAVIAREAAMQSRRTWLPEVTPVLDFAAAAALPGAALADPQGDPPSLDHPVVLVGPEGGWGDGERAVGLPTVRLAEQILRTETAALTAGAIFAALRSGMVKSIYQLWHRVASVDPHGS
jgi:16S rRNA (uracil1498-N3)-methyltransferase